jgi:hypothetical protein
MSPRVYRESEPHAHLTHIEFLRPRNQSAIIIASIGFSILQTTLLGCVIGVGETVAIWTACVISSRTGSRAWVIFVYYLPNNLGTILASTLPWTNNIRLLFSVWMISVSFLLSYS